jgi:prolyl oligopeptidase
MLVAARVGTIWRYGMKRVQMTLAAMGVGVAMASALALAAPPAPPTTEKKPVEETIHGQKFVDQYRWLEGDNSDEKNMGKVTPEVSAWTDKQNEYTRAVLDGLPGRKQLEEKLRPLMEIGSVSAPIMRGKYYFYTKREGKENQPRVFVREGAIGGGGGGTPRVLLDLTQVDYTGLTALGGMVPSQDGKYLAVGLYRAGDENTTVYVIETASGQWLADQIEGKAAVGEWFADNSGFFYEKLADVKNPYSAQIKMHTLGRHPKGDRLLFRQYTPEENKELATTWGPGGTFSKDGRWMVLNYWTGGASQDVWAIDLHAADKTKPVNEARKDIKVGAQNKFSGDIQGDTFYMLTDYGAPNLRLVGVNLNHPEEAAGGWKVIVPESKDAVLKSFGLAKGIIACTYEEKASTKIKLFDMDGAPKGELRMPGIGTAGLSTEDDRTEAFLSFTSFNYPPTIFRVDLATPDAEPVVWERPAVPVDPATVEVKQVTYSSKDGTPVTMFVVHKKGLKLDGNNPTILNGYGGFDISMTPSFSATLYQWFELGGVFALPNLRGGGEYGKQWHEGAMHEKKQNTFDDMIGAAEYLISSNYTNPKKLGCIGGSNGGLLMGAMMTQRPDLFAAVVCQVPLLDMLRYQNFLMARYWVGEYGSAEKKPEFDWLIKYSPYQNIKPGTKYPAILFTAGENDTRVHALHARKMAAAMQAATASDPATKPVLLWVDREAGHGQGKPLNLRIRDTADSRIFLMWQLGVLDGDANK